MAIIKTLGSLRFFCLSQAIFHHSDSSLKRSGLTLIELIVCTVIIGVLSATALPISKNFVQHQREEALKERLREIREAIDRYREKIRKEFPDRSEDECYPKNLEDLVERRALREIPLDPFTNSRRWRTISSSDSKESIDSDQNNVFDVRSLATGTAFDSTFYCDW